VLAPVVHVERLQEKLRVLVWAERRKGLSSSAAGALIEEIKSLQETDPKRAMGQLLQSCLVDELGEVVIDLFSESVELPGEVPSPGAGHA